ncbi:MAG TPA: glycoside hydrolase family 2 TIM barrel-domain containing protein [Steroidobacteraceae bacterium]|nr:glycoside hydrolase family 2 TIM barrel-domain containing protein [Steroidobacteraceae bacterium]
MSEFCVMRWSARGALRLARVIALGCLLASAAFGSTRIDLNRGWTFRTDPEQSGEASGWSSRVPAATDSINVPHTWNIGRDHAYLGTAWYFRSFEAPSQPAPAQVELHFGATFYSARVWLNGVELGRHEGGFTAYSFDITQHLRPVNFLAVEIDNRPGIATIPGFGARGEPQAWYDWWAYGGIVRDVWLTTSGPLQVRRQQIRSEVHEASALVHDRIFLRSAASRASTVRLRTTTLGPDNLAGASTSRSLTVAPGESEVEVTLELAKPALWSIDRPNVYSMLVELVKADGTPLDQHTDTFGVRRIEIRDRHLLVNGEHVRLTGMARHEDSPWEGLAETAGTMRHDYDDMKALQVTLTRPVHYPQHPFILDYADRHGILLIPEIPVWQFNEAQLSDPKVLALAQQQMREMIEQAGNHPSIFAWSVLNESATATPGGIAYVRAMRDFIRKLDPGRFVSYADDNLPKLERADQSAANDVDFLMMNQYFGAWHGPAEALVPSLDKVERMFPDKVVIISEFGFPGIFASNPAAADRARVKTMRDQLPELARRDWIAGAILWCYQDYKSRRNLWPGQEEGYVEHGVVDENRQRKPSYAVWKDLNTPARIEARWNLAPSGAPTDFTATATPNSEQQLPSYPLHDYRLSWQLLDEKNQLVQSGERPLAEFKAPQTISGTLPQDSKSHVFHLIVTLLRPAGTVAAERSLEWP